MENIKEKIAIRFPETEAEWAQIIKNQSEIFGDSEASYDDFYIYVGRKCTLAAFCGEKLAGAVNFPEISYPTKEKTSVGGYIFAAWVAPEFRGQGVFATLMAEAEKVMRERGYDFALVVPAEEGLFAMYEKFGYTAKVKNAFPYSAPREILREYNPTDDLYMLWKVYERVHDTYAKSMDFFNYTLQVAEAEGKCFAISKRGYIVYAPCYDNTVTVYDRMENGKLIGGRKTPVRALCKAFGGETFENTEFNMFFEPEEE